MEVGSGREVRERWIGRGVYMGVPRAHTALLPAVCCRCAKALGE